MGKKSKQGARPKEGGHDGSERLLEFTGNRGQTLRVDAGQLIT